MFEIAAGPTECLTKEGIAAMETIALTPRQQELFWAMADKSDGCWNWTRRTTPTGYGFYTFRSAGTSISKRAHRVAYMLSNRGIDDGLVIDHICHNILCVNPAHLRAVTPKANNENRLGPNKNSKSGIRGVSWDKQSKIWVVQVGHNGTIVKGGRHKTKEAAAADAIALRNRLFMYNDTDRVSQLAR